MIRLKHKNDLLKEGDLCPRKTTKMSNPSPPVPCYRKACKGLPPHPSHDLKTTKFTTRTSKPIGTTLLGRERRHREEKDSWHGRLISHYLPVWKYRKSIPYWPSWAARQPTQRTSYARNSSNSARANAMRALWQNQNTSTQSPATPFSPPPKPASRSQELLAALQLIREQQTRSASNASSSVASSNDPQPPTPPQPVMNQCSTFISGETRSQPPSVAQSLPSSVPTRTPRLQRP